MKNKNKNSSASSKDTNISVNPFSQIEYQLPKDLNDKENIDNFLDKHRKKKVIVIQGLGYVGAVMSVVCANAINDDYAVIGVDLLSKDSYWKIASINEGIFPVMADDPKIEQFYRNAMYKGNIFATFDEYAYSLADIIIIDIGLDVQINYTGKKKVLDYDADMSAFENSMRVISDNCKSDALILIETTVPPGTSEKIAYPILIEGLKKRGVTENKIKLGHSSERVMPGPDYIDSIQNFYRVYAGIDKKSADATEDFLRTIISTEKFPLTRLGSTNATEISKVLENSYRAMNIAFISEWSRFAEEAGVDLHEIIDAIRLRPTHSNIMYPGIGVGGYCLTKDPLLASWSRQKLFNSRGLVQNEQSVNINNQMPKEAFDFLVSRFPDEVLGKNICLLGVSYRGDVSDTRSSPVDSFYQHCVDSNCNVFLHDPFVSFWKERQVRVQKYLGEVLRPGFDVVVISAGHSLYKTRKFIDHLIIVKPKIIFDSLGILSNENLNRLKRVSKVCVIGRGDLD